MELSIAEDDPRREDVQALLEVHLAMASDVTPAGHVHALDVDGLLDPSVTFYSAVADGEVVGVGALRHLDDGHGEIKSMHTSSAARGQGIGRAVLDHLLAVAAERGYRQVSLETGTMDEFEPARSLYRKAGFVPCEPFGDYWSNEFSTCMTITLDADN